MPGSVTYDLLYRTGAASKERGWDKGAGPELLDLLGSGRLSPAALTPGRAVDLGCGTGANAIALAQRGFSVVGVDFSSVAIERARKAAAEAGVPDLARFVVGDITSDAIEGADGPFDLVVSYNTLQDLRGKRRLAAARTVAQLTRPGGQVLLWCYYRDPHRLPWYSTKGPSRLVPLVIRPGEEGALFARDFEIERLPQPEIASGFAAFLMTRR
jgi:SAM-dependent methyltransferase